MPMKIDGKFSVMHFDRYFFSATNFSIRDKGREKNLFKFFIQSQKAIF
jgi:hypothetical protein